MTASPLTLKRTPLFEAHVKLGARMVDFGGWEMPVQYTGIIDEHRAVRTAAGVFDISHMGEVQVSGPSACAFLNAMLTNDLRKLAPGTGQYTLMCNERGGVIDDLYAYRLAEEAFLLVINASRIDADLAWLQGQFRQAALGDATELRSVSDETGAVAVQGPKAASFIDACFSGSSTGGTLASRATDLKKNQVGQFELEGAKVWIARTGYTGEDGFEVIASSQMIGRVWDRILDTGRAHGLKPAGLGARDTLRTEACYPLYGHELDEETTPLEAGLGFFVALDKPQFIGREPLLEQKRQGVRKRCVAFKMAEKSAPPRPGYEVWSAGAASTCVGKVVSGTQSPSLGIGIGLAYVLPDFAKPDTQIEIEIRGRRAAATVVAKPIYKKPV